MAHPLLKLIRETQKRKRAASGKDLAYFVELQAQLIDLWKIYEALKVPTKALKDLVKAAAKRGKNPRLGPLFSQSLTATRQFYNLVRDLHATPPGERHGS